jgi:hypothetical protein
LTVAVVAQNSPPKPESDCGLTRMCLQPVAPAGNDPAPSWVAELVIFAVFVLIAGLAYRLLLTRRLR